MKKYVFKIVIPCVISTLSLVTVLCCDFSGMQVAEAGSSSIVLKKEKAVPLCHASKVDKKETPNQKNCSCCKEKRIQADLPTNISLNTYKTIIDYVALSLLPEQVAVFRAQFNLTYLNGPPGPISDIPLYLHSHNLRI